MTLVNENALYVSRTEHVGFAAYAKFQRHGDVLPSCSIRVFIFFGGGNKLAHLRKPGSRSRQTELPANLTRNLNFWSSLSLGSLQRPDSVGGLLARPCRAASESS